jgi:hypothetical protein
MAHITIIAAVATTTTTTTASNDPVIPAAFPALCAVNTAAVFTPTSRMMMITDPTAVADATHDALVVIGRSRYRRG